MDSGISRQSCRLGQNVSLESFIQPLVMLLRRSANAASCHVDVSEGEQRKEGLHYGTLAKDYSDHADINMLANRQGDTLAVYQILCGLRSVKHMSLGTCS